MAKFRKSNDSFLEEATRIVEAGKERGFVLRTMGACAVKTHCPKFIHLHNSLGRELSDIDFMSYSKFSRETKTLLCELGYIPNERFIALHGKKRHIYIDESQQKKIDVFFDKLEMCHTIDFRGRLEFDYPTIALADIVLQKMQIVEINEKDIIDTIVLLREHKVGETEDETVNAKYIAKTLANDWGFYHTTTSNLNKVKGFLEVYRTLTVKDRAQVTDRIGKLLQAIEEEPKPLKWRMRAKIGTKKKWYTDVHNM